VMVCDGTVLTGVAAVKFREVVERSNVPFGAGGVLELPPSLPPPPPPPQATSAHVNTNHKRFLNLFCMFSPLFYVCKDS